MLLNMFRAVATAGTLCACGIAAPAAVVHAQPPPPPWIPGAPLPQPGSFQYNYNTILVAPPATNDARGVRIGTTVDTAASAAGLPGSELGNSPNKPNAYTSSSTRYRIQGGITPPVAPNPGMNIGGGNEGTTLEDPYGKPPGKPAGAESASPEGGAPGPAVPAPIIESADGKPKEAESSPQGPTGAESAAADAPVPGPAVPAPVLEEPHGHPPT
ncbi:hypothetical protein BOO86_04525 [Mycobacterium sp. CBMA 234]|nr:hypothetical protein [Mycolicibacterium sp. CBMA 234]